MMRALRRPGGTAPLHASGVGKALLAALPDDEAARLVGGGPLARFTPGTIVDAAGLAVEHAAARRRGYAIDDEEFAPGLRCVAAAIHDGAGRPVAALSLSGPSARITDGRIDQLGRLVRDRAMAVTQAIGGRSARVPAES
jgi:IclR family acetate operon transcriptional repressor